MKQDEIRIGLWLRNRTDHKNHARVIYVSEKPSALTWIWNRSDKPYSCRLDEASRYFDAISTPAELKAAGVGDEDRLIEQQSWREGVRLWDWPTSVCPFISIDDDIIAGVTGKIDTINCPSNGKKPKALNNGDNESPTDLTSDPRYAEVWQREHLRDFVLSHRSRRAGGEGKKKLACGLEVRVGDLFRFTNLAVGHRKFLKLPCRVDGLPANNGSFPMFFSAWDEGKWDGGCAAHCNDEIALLTPAEIASTTIKLDDIHDEKLRAAVEALRRPTLPDGSRIEIGEMYVSKRGWLQRVLVRSLSGETWQRDYFDPNCKRWLSGLPADDRGECSTHANNLARLAQPADIPPEVSIDIVPERIREQVRQQRGAGALKWWDWGSLVFRSTKDGLQMWHRDEWVKASGDSLYFNAMSDATPAQIIAANVPEQDIPAAQLDGVRAERAKQAASPSSPPTSTDSQTFDLADGRRIGVSADMSCGKPVLSVTELESPSSPPPESEKQMTVDDENRMLLASMTKLHKAAKNARGLLRIMFDMGCDNEKPERQQNLIDLTEAIADAERTRDAITLGIVESLGVDASPNRDAPTWTDGTPISKAEYIYALESTGVPGSEIEIRQSPESGACKCEAANTTPSILSDSWRSIRKFDDAEKCIRQMVDDCLHDQSDNIKAHFVRSLRRHFEDLVYYAKFRRELARESLGVEANGKDVAA